MFLYGATLPVLGLGFWFGGLIRQLGALSRLGIWFGCWHAAGVRNSPERGISGHQQVGFPVVALRQKVLRVEPVIRLAILRG